MSRQNDDAVKRKCKDIIGANGFDFWINDVLSVNIFCRKYPKLPHPPFHWQYLEKTKNIIYDSMVNIDDVDFEKSFFHEYYHHEFAVKYYRMFKSRCEKVCFRILTEIYAEKKTVKAKGCDPFESWQDVIGYVRLCGIEDVLLSRYKEFLNAGNNEWDSIVYTLSFFIRIYLNCKKYRSDLDISSNNPGKNRLEQQLLSFFRYIRNHVIPVSIEKLAGQNNLIENFKEQIVTLNSEL